MSKTDILAIVITQSVITVCTLIVGYVRLRQEIHSSLTQLLRSRRLDRQERQLAEFYGPLHMLAASGERAYKMAWGTDIWKEVLAEVLIPGQEEMEKILLSRIHLVEGDSIPESYLDFLNHVRLVRCYGQKSLTVSYFEKEVPYPERFNQDIAAGYARKRAEYIAALGGAERGGTG